jgi:hypothetical protein
MLLVMQVLAQLLVRSAVLVRCHHWSPLTVALVPMVFCLMNQVLIRCLMGDFLHRICGCRGVRPRGMAFLFGHRVRVRANTLCIELLLWPSALWLLVVLIGGCRILVCFLNQVQIQMFLSLVACADHGLLRVTCVSSSQTRVLLVSLELTVVEQSRV